MTKDAYRAFMFATVRVLDEVIARVEQGDRSTIRPTLEALIDLMDEATKGDPE